MIIQKAIVSAPLCFICLFFSSIYSIHVCKTVTKALNKVMLMFLNNCWRKLFLFFNLYLLIVYGTIQFVQLMTMISYTIIYHVFDLSCHDLIRSGNSIRVSAVSRRIFYPTYLPEPLAYSCSFSCSSYSVFTTEYISAMHLVVDIGLGLLSGFFILHQFNRLISKRLSSFSAYSFCFC